MDAAQVGTGRDQLARPAARGEQQRVISENRAVIEPKSLLASRDFFDAAAEVRLHGMIRVELRRPDHQPVALERAGEVFFRQGWPLVGQPRLVPDHSQLPREPFAA